MARHSSGCILPRSDLADAMPSPNALVGRWLSQWNVEAADIAGVWTRENTQSALGAPCPQLLQPRVDLTLNRSSPSPASRVHVISSPVPHQEVGSGGILLTGGRDKLVNHQPWDLYRISHAGDSKAAVV